MISVVIPLYNKEKSIAKTLQSVLTQTYTDYEIIVVDDGSTDASVEVVQSVMKQTNKIQLLQKSNGGVSSARNHGIRNANSEYVAFLDGDDIWNKDYLKTQVELIKDYPDSGMWGVNYADIYDGKVNPYNQGVPKNMRGYVLNYFSTSHGDIFWTSAVVVQREAAISVGLFDERIKISEDMDFWYRIILNYPVCFYDKIFAYYNKDAENRVEKDTTAHYDIYACWDYYIDKYEHYFRTHPDFARFVGMRVAINILSKGYYFGNDRDQVATNHIIKYLPYANLPLKYRFIFKSPRWFGKIVYKLSTIVKKIKGKCL